MSSQEAANRGTYSGVSGSNDLTGPLSRGSTAPGLGAAIAARGVVGVVVLMAVLGFWRLDRYPRTWFDEGSYFEVTRSLIEHGRYVAESPDGTRDFAPTMGTGPTVLLPAAALQSAWDTSLTAGRVVGVVYLILATAALYLLARRLFGNRSALFSFAVLLALPALAWVATGRQLLGEVPAVFFLIAGAALAFRGRTLTGGAIAGLILGLAMVTKGQYLLILPLSICAVALFDFVTARVRPLRWYAVLLGSALGAYAAWIGILLALIGGGGIAENYRLLRETSSGALLILDLDRMRAGWTLLLGPRSLFLIAPAVLYGLILALKTQEAERRLALASLWVFQALWLGWFATASIAWPRYAFAGLAINALFAGVMLSDLFGALSRHGDRAQFVGNRRQRAAAGMMAIALVLLLAGGYRQLAPVVSADQREPQRFAAALDQRVPHRAVVDGWEPEINFLSESAMQYPPLGSLDRVVRAAWLDTSRHVDLSSTLSADYLVVGYFGRWVGVYDEALASGQYRLLLDVGGYELYERRDVP